MQNITAWRSNSLFWLTFFAFVAFAWLLLYWMALYHPAGPLWGAFSTESAAPRNAAGHIHGHGSFLYLCLMWGLMSGAMMLPTAAPTIQAFFDLTRSKAGARLWPLYFMLGYLAMWLIFSVPAALLQLQLTDFALLSDAAVSISPWLTVLLLALAGLYQFSPLKERCVTKCRAPMSFLLQHWRAGSAGALRLGLLHGLYCLGCCWALMLLGFVGGAMNLVWMGIATLLMILEKLPSLGKPLTPVLGIALLLGAAYAALLALGWA